jgi:hypothetical protein
VEHPLDLGAGARPWRTLTLIAAVIAAVEFLVIFGMFAAKPLVLHLKQAAVTKATEVEGQSRPQRRAVGTPKLTRRETSVLVLNGNGRNGAAGRMAARVRRRGYLIGGVGDARRSDYARSIVMYRKGLRSEAYRLARDFHIRVVGPVDGMERSELLGAHLALIVGR